MIRRLTLALIGATAVLVLTPALATPATPWEGQWNPHVRLDTAQVAFGPPCEVVGTDTMGLPMCDPEPAPPGVPTGEDPADWQPHPDVIDPATGEVHTGCEAMAALPDLDLPEVIVCSDGWTYDG